MNNLVNQFFVPLSPILAIVLSAIGVTILECFPKVSLQRAKFALSCFGVLCSLACTLFLWREGIGAPTAEALSVAPTWLAEFHEQYRLDIFSLAFFFAAGVFTLISLILVHFHFTHREGPREIYLLVLFVSMGIYFLISANSLLILFLALELLSLPSYILVGAQKGDHKGAEAALKYFLFGSFATVLLVLGMAFLYSNYGTLHLTTLAKRIADYLAYANSPPEMLIFTLAAIALLIVAGGFKVGLAPFHMWVPDTYEGASTPVTAFMGSAVKLAGFALLARLFWGVLLPLSDRWVVMLNALAVVSMFWGNLAALKQDNLKRLFAYSSISHAGYLILALTSVSAGGAPQFEALYYYLFTYGLTFLGFFAAVSFIEMHEKTTNIYELSGLGFSKPWLGACVALLVLSAAGIPPTAGFLAKYLVFLEAIKAGHTITVILAVVSSLIGAYYYLRILVYLYMKEGKTELTLARKQPLLLGVIVFTALSMLVLAAFPKLF